MAAGSIGGAVLGASSQKKAATQASNAELQMSRENNALAQQFRAENTANFQPWMQSGTRANSLIDSFLYGPAPADYYSGQPAPQSGTQTAPVYSQTPLNTNTLTPASFGAASPAERAARMGGEPMGLPTAGPQANGDHIATGGLGALNVFADQPTMAGVPSTVAAQPQQQPQQNPQQNPLSPTSGFSAFVNSPYYQFGQNEGMRALNTGLASRGMIESGDAIKSAIRYGQDYGYSQGLMPFLGLAGQQSDRGVQSASAIAGVGQNALASMTANNNNAGNAMANAALAKGAANANMFSGIGSALGTFAGGLGGSSYGGGAGGITFTGGNYGRGAFG
jgi:hypothetical protein